MFDLAHKRLIRFSDAGNLAPLLSTHLQYVLNLETIFGLPSIPTKRYESKPVLPMPIDCFCPNAGTVQPPLPFYETKTSYRPARLRNTHKTLRK